jgi:hypothetical protein
VVVLNELLKSSVEVLSLRQYLTLDELGSWESQQARLDMDRRWSIKVRVLFLVEQCNFYRKNIHQQTGENNPRL